MKSYEIEEANQEAVVANDSHMLAKANEHISKLEIELKIKTKEYQTTCERMIFYKTMLMKILDL